MTSFADLPIATTYSHESLPGMVGTHPLMREVYRLVRQAAPTDLPVAIVGETGVGKELVARALHQLSVRRQGPFIAVNSAALPETLFESELFGHERGAFSDARNAKPGLLEVAHRGSFFCDEISALSPPCQAKLLRVVEEGAARRIGGIEPKGASPRWIVACQAYDAVNNVAMGLRSDLWYRLSGVMVLLPPLRKRASDIPALVTHLLTQGGFDWARIDPAAMDCLSEASWPGNVRQLRQVLQRLVLRADGARITRADVRAEVERDPGHARERAEILSTLLAHRWNIRAAARALGMAPGTLYRRMRAAALERPQKVFNASLDTH